MTTHLYLVDTSVWVRLFRSHTPPRLRERIDGLLRARRIAVNGLIRLELLAGARGHKQFQELQSTFGRVINLSWSEELWDKAASLGFSLRRQGLTTSTPDLVVAASALEHEAVLIHADADFDRIASHSDLKVESYAAVA